MIFNKYTLVYIKYQSIKIHLTGYRVGSRQAACSTKRLEEGQFIWPAVRDGKVSITRSQLAMLLDKLDWRPPKESRLNSLIML